MSKAFTWISQKVPTNISLALQTIQPSSGGQEAYIGAGTVI